MPVAPFLLLAALLAQAPTGWDDTYRRGLQLIANGKAAEAIRLFDGVVQRAPAFGSGHAALADAHRARADQLAGGAAAPPSAWRQELELAARHYRRAIDLQAPERPLAVIQLMRIYGEDRLNQAGEQAAFARQHIALQPESAIGHTMLSQALRRSGQAAAATAALLAGRAPVRGRDRALLATMMIEHATATTDLPPGDLRQMLDFAAPVLDEAIEEDPSDRQRVRTKVALLVLRADRLETDPKRRQALRAEADRLFDAGRPANAVPAAAPAGGPLEPPPGYGAASTEAVALIAKGQFVRAAAIYERFVTSHPAYPPAHYQRLGALLQAGRRDGIDAALKAARTAAPATPPARQLMGVYLWDVGTRTKGLAPADAALLLFEANRCFDEVLVKSPESIEALTYKGIVLRALAPLATDPAKAKALVAEADALRSRARALRRQQDELDGTGA